MLPAIVAEMSPLDGEVAAAVWENEVDKGETLSGVVVCCELLEKGEGIVSEGNW